MYVINLDFPKQIEDYVHRIGRCGRCDRMGISYAFFTLNDAKQAKELIAILNEANQPIDAKLQEIAYNPQKVEKIDKKQRRLNESSGFEASLPEKRRHDGSNANFPSSSNIRGADLGERDGRNVSFTEIGPSSSNVRERDGRNFISGSIVRDDNIGDINSRNTNFNDMDPGSSNLRGAFMGERDGRNLDFNEIGLIGANVRGPRLGELDGRNVGLKEFDTNSSSARGARLGERDGRNFGFNDVGPSSPIVRGPQLGERDDRRFDFDDIGPSGSNGRGTANYGEPDSKRRRMGFEQIERNSFFDRNDVGDFRNSRNVDNDMLRRLDDRGFQEDSKFGRIRDREDDIIDRDRLFDERPPQQQRLFDRMDEPRMGSGRSNDFDAPQRFASSKNFNRDEDLIALDRMRNSSGPNFDQRESEFNRLNNLQDGSFCRKERDYFDVLDRPIDSLSRNAMNNPSGEMFNLSTADRRNYEREFRGRDNSNSYRVGSDNFDNDLPNRPFDSLIDRYDRNIDGMTGNTAFNSNRFPNGPRDQNSPLRNFENSREDFRESFQSSRFDTSDMRNDFIDDRDPDRWNNSAPRDNYPQNRREFGNDPEMRQRNNFEHLNMGRDSNLSFAGNNNFDGDFQNRNQRDFGRRNVNDRFNRFN
ncbi:ATP-dependent RNA helicase dbp2 [Pseudolycoriella hygida]|uniref:ATP-dependent RNA helicase dbp2 n=1 Tax=Pseudolycoriella hygida TaxID=35572 RepID=A0A9Q0N7Q9_9DIPT|nr:ATP-dependent RNA helicase dbp2 [Pseudolycoriella hygida]